MRLMPGNCYILGQYDYILYMGLHHHICRDYGWISAFWMLKELLNHTKYMFFTMEEPKTDKQFKEWKDIFPHKYMTAPREWLRDWFDANHLKNSIIYTGPKRNLYLIER